MSRYRSGASPTIIILTLIGLVMFLVWAGIRIVAGISFKQDCSGYLKRAADANTVELADKELSRAVTYIENNQLTSGYTSVIYRTPDEDLGFWYSNLKASQKELQEISPEATQLERTNVLMKLRETLLDDGEKGQSVTQPDGISVYPNNAVLWFIGLLSLLMTCVFGFIWFYQSD